MTTQASYDETIEALAEGLQALEDAISTLGDEDWKRPTLLRPAQPDAPPWDVLTLAAHFDVFMGLVLGLLGGAGDDPPVRDGPSFCMSVGESQMGPVIYQYVVDHAQGHTPSTIVDTVRDTFKKAMDGIRTTPPDTVGPAFVGPIRLDEFVATRVLEAVIHGMDLTDALGRPPLSMPKGIPIAAGILDEILARTRVAGRPADLAGDDLAFIRAASGRGEHSDPRFPIVG